MAVVLYVVFCRLLVNCQLSTVLRYETRLCLIAHLGQTTERLLMNMHSCLVYFVVFIGLMRWLQRLCHLPHFQLQRNRRRRSLFYSQFLFQYFQFLSDFPLRFSFQLPVGGKINSFEKRYHLSFKNRFTVWFVKNLVSHWFHLYRKFNLTILFLVGWLFCLHVIQWTEIEFIEWTNFDFDGWIENCFIVENFYCKIFIDSIELNEIETDYLWKYRTINSHLYAIQID